MTLQEIHEWVFDELGLCGCGDPDGVLDLLRSVLLAIRQRSDDNEHDHDHETCTRLWSQHTDEIKKLIGMEENPTMAWAYLYHLSDLGLLEHGGNCLGSWLDEKGHEVLNALLKYDSEAIIEPQEDIVLDATEIG